MQLRIPAQLSWPPSWVILMKSKTRVYNKTNQPCEVEKYNSSDPEPGSRGFTAFSVVWLRKLMTINPHEWRHGKFFKQSLILGQFSEYRFWNLTFITDNLTAFGNEGMRELFLSYLRSTYTLESDVLLDPVYFVRLQAGLSCGIHEVVYRRDRRDQEHRKVHNLRITTTGATSTDPGDGTTVQAETRQ